MSNPTWLREEDRKTKITSKTGIKVSLIIYNSNKNEGNDDDSDKK